MFICDEEQQILHYLKSSPEAYFSTGQICKRACGRELYTKEPRWAIRFLSGLLDKKLVERDDQGHYRYLDEDARPADAAD